MKTEKLIKPLTLALILSLAAGQLGRIPGLPSGVNVYVFDLIAGLLFVLSWRQRRLNDAISRAGRWFVAVAGLSWLLAFRRFTLNEWLISGAYLLRFDVYFGLYLVYKSEAVKKLKLPLKLWLSYLAIAWGVIGLIQYLFLPDTRFLFFSNWDDHYYRLIGSLADPNFLGLMFILGVILSRAWWLVLPLLLTYSRSSYLAGLTTLGVWAWLKRSWRWLVGGIVALVIILPLLPRPGGEGVNLLRTYSLLQRGQNLEEGLSIWLSHPVLGVGFNTLRYYRHNQGLLGPDWQVTHAGAGLDNSFVFVAATTGMVGLIFYLNFLRLIWLKGSLTVKLSLTAILVHSFFQNSLFYPLVMIWLWLLVAINPKD